MLFRRASAILVGVVFFVLLLAVFAWHEVSNTLLNPDYLAGELRAANAYELVLNDLLSSLVDEARALDADEFPGEFGQNPLVASGLATEDIVASVNRAIPADWTQEQIELAIDQIGMYVTGQREEFTLTPRADAQATIMIEELEGLIKKADTYDLLFDEFVAPEIEQFIEEEVTSLGIDIPVERVFQAARTVVPPAWAEEQTLAALHEVAEYIVGRRDSFEITVPLGERAETAVEETKQVLRDADVYSQLFDSLIAPALEDAVAEGPSPIVPVENDRLLEAARRIVTPEWLQAQTERLIDEAGPYITGTEDEFELRVPISDRVALGMEEAWLILEESDQVHILYDMFVEPKLRDALGEVVPLPFGAFITGDEVVLQMRHAASREWFRNYAEQVVSDATAYLAGEAEYFESSVPLLQIKGAVVGPLASLANARIENEIKSLPRCENPMEADSARQSRKTDELPQCIGPDMTTAQVMEELGVDMSRTVTRTVMSRIPDHAVIGERQLRQAFGHARVATVLDLYAFRGFARHATDGIPGQLEVPNSTNGRPASRQPPDVATIARLNVATFDLFVQLSRDGLLYDQDELRGYLAGGDGDQEHRLDELRGVLRDGWTFTESDLHSLIRREAWESESFPRGVDPATILDGVRMILSEDWMYTDEDLRSGLVASGGTATLRSFNWIRTGLKGMPFFVWGLWVVLALLLVGVGVLGSREWRGRCAWAMTTLTVSAGLIYVALSPDLGDLRRSGPIYEAAGIPDLAQIRQDALEYKGPADAFPASSKLMVNMLFDLGESSLQRLVEGVSDNARRLAVLGLVGLAATGVWTVAGIPRVRAATVRIARRLRLAIHRRWPQGNYEVL